MNAASAGHGENVSRHWLEVPDAGQALRLAVVLGNTHCRVAVMEGAEPRATLVIPTSGLREEGAAQELRAFAGERVFEDAGLCSVVPGREEDVRALCEAAGLPGPRVVRPAVSAFFPSLYRSMDTLGADRYCGVLAAHAVYGAPAVVADCGTATTVNVLGVDGVFLGGAIAPGIGTALRAMHERTAQLPLAELPFADLSYAALSPDGSPAGASAARGLPLVGADTGESLPLVGADTEESLPLVGADTGESLPLVGADTGQCLRSGAVHFTRLAVEGWAREMKKQYGDNTPLILTGGAAPVFGASGLAVSPLHADEKLLFRGVLFHLLFTTGQ